MEHDATVMHGGGPMSNDVEGAMPTRVYATDDGHAVIEQSQGSVVPISAEQILAVVNELHACYDYCAAWKDATHERDLSTTEMKP
jgi:hypothetical protein